MGKGTLLQPASVSRAVKRRSEVCYLCQQPAINDGLCAEHAAWARQEAEMLRRRWVSGSRMMETEK